MPDHTRTLLLVEDDRLVAIAESAALKGRGYRVVSAPTGEAAVARIENDASADSVDLVLMDIDLGPGIDGIEAARRILDLRHLPIVFLSGHSEPEVVDRTQRVTSYGYVLKNSPVTIIDASVRTAFNLFDARRRELEATEARAESEIRYRQFASIVENADGVAVIKDTDRRIIVANERFVRFAGASSLSELVGKTDADILGVDADSPLTRAYKLDDLAAMSLPPGEEIIREEEVPFRDGTSHIMRTRKFPIWVDGGLVGLGVFALDITEARRTEQRLRESRETLDAVINTAPQAIFWKDVAGQYLGCNRAFAHAVGLSDPADIIGKTDADLPWSPEEATAYRADDQEVIDTNEPKMHILEPLRQADGKRLQIDTCKMPLRDSTGRPYGVLGIYQDVTERERSNARLRLQSMVLDQIADCVTVTDLDGTITYVNEAESRLFRVPRETLIGRSVRSYGEDERDGPTQDEIIRQTRRAGGWRGEVVNRTPDGRTVTMEVRTTAVLDDAGKPFALCGISTDVSDRKRIEQALIARTERLRESQAELAAIIENSPFAMMIVDEDWRVRKVSDKNAEFFASEANGMIGLRCGDVLRCSHSQDVADGCGFGPECDGCALRTSILDTIHSGHRHREVEFVDELRLDGSDGDRRRNEPRTTLVYTSPLPASAGQKRALVFFQDVTERKRMQDELARRLSETELLLREVHHRIKNNIASIGSLLSLQTDTLTNPEAKAALQEANGRVASLRVLYEKLLVGEDFGHLSATAYLNELVDSVVDAFPIAGTVTVERSIDEVYPSPRRLFPLGLIINELMTNALKYAFVGRATGRLHVSLRCVGERALLSVCDDGLGLPADFDLATSQGFGLTLVAMLTEQLGGSLRIRRLAQADGDPYDGTGCEMDFPVACRIASAHGE